MRKLPGLLGLALFFCLLPTPVTAASTSQPDLVVQDIKFYLPTSAERPEDEVSPVVGRAVACKAILKNIGSVDTGIFNVKWFIDGLQVNYSSHSGLAAGAVSDDNVRFDWIPAQGEHTISFTADPDKHIPEANEDNNNFNKAVSPAAIPKPDLVVTGIKFYRPKSKERPQDEVVPVMGRKVTCKAILKNQGDSPVEIFNVKWFVDGIQQGYGAHAALASGATSNDNVRFDWIPASGRYTIRFLADSDDFIEESDEDNNDFTLSTDNKQIDIPPSGSIKINNDEQYANTANVILGLLAQANTPGSALSKMKFSNDNITWSEPESYSLTKSWALTSGDGTKTVFVKYKDSAGIWSADFLDTITLDTASPITAASGIDGSWHNSSVTVTLTPANTGSGIDKTYYSLDGSMPSTLYAGPFTISTEGALTLKYYSIDKAGNTEEVKSALQQIKIDKATPIGSVKINNGAEITGFTEVTLTLTSQDMLSGVSGMQFSNDGVNYSAEEGFAATKTWALAPANGAKTVYVKFKDAAGNWSSPISNSISLDTTGPTGSLKINNGSETAKSTSITLTLTSADNLSGVTKMQFSNDGVNYSVEEAYSAAKTWSLTSGDGAKTVYVKFKDAVGNWSEPISSSITLDTILPVTSVSGIDSAWHNSSVRVTLTTSEPVLETYYSYRDGVPLALYTGPFIVSEEGVFTLKYYSIDKAGNKEEPKTAVNKIKIDKAGPAGSIKINNGLAITTSNKVTLALTSEDKLSGVAGMSFSNDNLNWSSLEDFILTKPWELIKTDGIKTIYVKYKDLAGNWSNIYSAIIDLQLDRTAPVTSVSGIDGSWHNSSVTVTLSPADTGSGIDKTYYSLDGSMPSTLYAGPFTISEEGIFTLKFYSIDKEGNREEVKTAASQIKIDTNPPKISINPVNTPTEQNVTLIYTVSDNFTPKNEIIVTGDNSPYTSEGAYNVTLTAKDRAGNTSTSAISFTIYRPYFPPPPPPLPTPVPDTALINEALQKVADNYAKVYDFTADMTLSSTLDGKPFGETDYCKYYFKSPDKEKTESFSDSARSEKIDAIIINGSTMHLVDPVNNIKQDVDLLADAGISAKDFSLMDVYHNQNLFLSENTVSKKSQASDMIITLDAVPKAPHKIYGKLSLSIDYKKGIIAKLSIYRRNSANELELVQETSTVEAKLMPNGAWLPVKMTKATNLSSGNLISTLTYENLKVNTGLADFDFDPAKQ